MEKIILLTETELKNILSEFVFTESKFKSMLGDALSEMKPQENDLITRFDVSKLLGLSLPTIISYGQLGILKPYKLGNKIRYKKSEVLDSLQVVKKELYKSKKNRL